MNLEGLKVVRRLQVPVVVVEGWEGCSELARVLELLEGGFQVLFDGRA
jgi:hypothetical protein